MEGHIITWTIIAVLSIYHTIDYFGLVKRIEKLERLIDKQKNGTKA